MVSVPNTLRAIQQIEPKERNIMKKLSLLSVFASWISLKLPLFKNLYKNSNIVIVDNPYPTIPGRSISARRNITELVKFNNRSHTAHQGKKECARRVKRGW